MNVYAEKLVPIIKDQMVAVEESLLKKVESQVKIVNNIGVHLTKAGGKRLRPALYLLCSYDAKLPLKENASLAASLELIHMATLVHDDVIDEASTRRGQPTANALWDNKISVLAGDYLLAMAFSSIADFIKPREIEVMANTIASVCEGEILQNINAFNADISMEDYKKKTFQKTANFIASSCELGAMRANFTEEQISKFQTYGNCLGMAFQITDDILDITGDTKHIGKPAGNDLKQGIITLPVIYALKNSPHKEELRILVSSAEITDEQVDKALEITKECGAVEYSYDIVRDYLQDAKNILPKELSLEVKNSLINVIDFVESRDY